MEKGVLFAEDAKTGAALDTCSRVLDGVAAETCSRSVEVYLKVGSAAMTCSRIVEDKAGVAAETCSRVLEIDTDGAAALDQYVNVWSN